MLSMYMMKTFSRTNPRPNDLWIERTVWRRFESILVGKVKSTIKALYQIHGDIITYRITGDLLK